MDGDRGGIGCHRLNVVSQRWTTIIPKVFVYYFHCLTDAALGLAHGRCCFFHPVRRVSEPQTKAYQLRCPGADTVSEEDAPCFLQLYFHSCKLV